LIGQAEKPIGNLYVRASSKFNQDRTVLKKAILPAVLLMLMTLSPLAAEARKARRAKPQTAPSVSRNIPGKFDFYVMALSWSPDYCAAKGDQDPQQCGQGKQLGFVLHGLWPQYDRGFPASCTNEAFEPSMQQKFPGLYPSTKLYTHEWEKHGTCSGLSQTAYHQLAADVKAAVAIPDRYQKPSQPIRTTLQELKNDFVAVNPGMSVDSVAPTCKDSGRFLQEVLVCRAKDGGAGTCSAEVLKKSQKSCAQEDFLVRSVR
jgi:ribonuclease T2